MFYHYKFTLHDFLWVDYSNPPQVYVFKSDLPRLLTFSFYNPKINAI